MATPDPNASWAIDRIVSKMFNWRDGTDMNNLFDPARSPEMYRISIAAHRNMRLGMAAGDIDCFDERGHISDLNDYGTPAVFVHIVGTNEVRVVPAQVEPLDQYADWYRCTWHKTVRTARADFCQIRKAPTCSMSDHYMQFWPWRADPFLLLFMVCPACRDRAIQSAEDGLELMRRDAEDGLPPGGVIDPGSPLPPLP
jgi:hypothetical protein